VWWFFSYEQWKNAAYSDMELVQNSLSEVWKNVEFSVHSVFQEGLTLHGPCPFCPPGFYSQYSHIPKKTEKVTALCGLVETGQQVTTKGRGRVPGT